MPKDTAVDRRQVRSVVTPHGRLQVNDFGGQEPAIVMAHGFPDDSRIYDRLIEWLGDRRALSFDFLGYGRSDRLEQSGPLMPGEHEAELGTVLDALDLDSVVLVGHDAGGPVVINWSLDHPERVRGLVLLNTYYGHAPTLQFPEMIRLLADPDLTPLADAILADSRLRGWILEHTGGRFGVNREGPDAVAQASIIPQFFGDNDQEDALTAVRAWTAELFVDLALQDRRITRRQLADFTGEVTLAFGARDPYLNVELAHHLAGHFSGAAVIPIDQASHWPQRDQPQATAEAILSIVGTNHQL